MAAPSRSRTPHRTRHEHAQAATSDSAALLEMSSILNSSQDLDFILGNVLLTAMGKLLLTRAVVLVESAHGSFRVRAAKGVSFPPGDPAYALPQDWRGFTEIASLKKQTDPQLRKFLDCCSRCGISALVPMLLDERMVGVVCVGPPATGRVFSPVDVTFLESLAAVAASAVNNALTIDTLQGINRRLDTKIQELNTLFELSREMNATFDEQRILRVLSYALMGQLRALRYAVFAWDGGTFQPVLVKLPDFAPRTRYQKQLAHIRAVTVFEGRKAPKTAAERWLQSLGFTTVIPMLTQNEVRGILCLGERMGSTGFDVTELDYLSAFANITITALENARLVKDTLEKQRLEKELSLARHIQKGLLPRRVHSPAGYEIAVTNESSQQVGGDYYDVIPLSDHEVVLAIGDVSGKGIPASLLMANVQAALRVIAPLRLPLPEATMRLNALVHENTGADKFITFFWGVLDAHAHTFEYINCGHNPPYIASPGSALRPLSTGGLILGVLENAPTYETETIPFRPNDILVTYTDGVNEAMNKTMKPFGDERLMRLIARLSTHSAAGMLDGIKKVIVEYTRGAEQSDDITMLVVKRTIV